MTSRKNHYRTEAHSAHRVQTPSSASSSKAQLSFLLNDEQNSHSQLVEHSSPALSLRDNSWRRQSTSSNFHTNRGSRTSTIPDHGMSDGNSSSTKYQSGVDFREASAYSHSSASMSQIPQVASQMHYQSSNNSSAMDISHITSGDLANGSNAASGDRRGVRKKRQRKFVCETCGFGFYTNSDLQKHVSSVHLLLRPYECSMCDKKFGERSNATKHFKSVHERQKNAECEICHKVFAFRDGLVRHVRLVHDNIRNFHCKYPGCGQSFKQSAHLKKHQQVHTKSRIAAVQSNSRAHNDVVYANLNTHHHAPV